MTDADRELIDRLLDDDLPANEQAALLAKIEGSAAGVAELAERALLHAGLQQALRREALQRTALRALAVPGSNVVSWQRLLPWGIAAAACVLAMFAHWPAGPAPDGNKGVVAISEPGQRVTALLVDEAGAVFERARQPGEVRFDPGSYELESGTVHLRFVNGADLVVEGPAKFEIRDALRTNLLAGRVRAIVPPTAKGFTMVTREVAYEDVGTEFGLSMDAATGESLMHVFDGQVNLRSGDAAGLLLRSVHGGESVGYRDGQLQDSPEMDASVFPSPENIGHLRWSLERRKWLADPGLIAWFPFERGANASLLVNAARDHGVPDGRIAGARWATGRWPGKQALWFDRESDFAEIEIPGEHTELTVAVWMKVDRLDREMIAILNSNGTDDGDLHFQMNRLGLPRGGLQGLDRVYQRWVGNPIPIGKWVHVASVTSLPERRIVFYVNGQPVHEAELKGDDVPIRPGHCRLGNWFAEHRADRESSRALRGLIDELSVWNRALSASELVALAESGRPSLLWSRENPPLKTPLPTF